MWCITKITAEYRKKMYRILKLYAKPYDKRFPVVCFDEKSKQLLADSRKSIPMKPGSAEKYDYEYIRNGTCNIFTAVEPKAGKHHIKVTDHRKRQDFAQFMRWLILTRYKSARKVRIVLDNLNTHFVKSFQETFPPEIVDKILKRATFIYTPKHASWLNMAEIEINMMSRECLSRNIGSQNEIVNEIDAWCKQNNLDKRKINWSFTKHRADKILSKHYVS
jgi:DDE superfamily endonuclease